MYTILNGPRFQKRVLDEDQNFRYSSFIGLQVLGLGSGLRNLGFGSEFTEPAE